MKLPTALRDLRDKFKANGFDLKAVGGCVRDSLMGLQKPKDIDLCTDATPDEQRAIYRTYNIRHIDTGLQHGTWTIVLDDVTYEITSLRTETDCDGRHAAVAYTRDWLADLARRDLTFNAILMDFDGKITDPFDGADDLKLSIVRFVGDANERMREDYLRILRWFRFHARIAKSRFCAEDVLTMVAIKANMGGLRKISRERVWSEFSRILSDPHGLTEVLMMINVGLTAHIDLPVPLRDNAVSFLQLERAHKFTSDPVSQLAAYIGTTDGMNALADAWKLSNVERDHALEVIRFLPVQTDLRRFAKSRIAMHGVSVDRVVQALLVKGEKTLATEILAWDIPVFPVSGQDILDGGFVTKPGPEIGRLLNQLRARWEESDYALTKESLLSSL